MKAHLRGIRMSPKKVHMVASVVRGMNADQAVGVLSNLPQKSAFYLHKVLKSALASAKESEKLNQDSLVVSEVNVQDGSRFRRFKAGSRGRAKPIIKRTCHLSVILTKK